MLCTQTSPFKYHGLLLYCMEEMKIGILGSGMVGQSLASGFLKSGYEVKIGTREPGKLKEWLSKAGARASAGSLSEAASFGEIVVLCVKGTEIESAIKLAGNKNFSGKIVIDVTNPLLFEQQNQPPKLSVGFPESNGSRVQKLLSNARVVKAFNIVTSAYMCSPKLSEGTPDMFIAGNDAVAKKMVEDIARGWGWPVTDLGGIEQAYLLEALAMLWITYGFMNNHWTHAFKILKK